jgi:hypothetical protein
MKDWDRLVEIWVATLRAVDRLGGYTNLETPIKIQVGVTHGKNLSPVVGNRWIPWVWGLNILPPATDADIERVQAQLGIDLPAALV